jgi:peptide-methionine (S)-S-oxide reductase
VPISDRPPLPALAGAAIPALALLALSACLAPAHADAPVQAPTAVIPAREAPGLKTAVFAGGCYWGMEAVFSHLKGVTSVVSGFEGGRAVDADYETVSTGTTGHAESIRVTYDPARIRYDQLLQVFFGVASDPTQLNRQEPDEGPQYRNALVPIGPEQARVARAYLAQLKALKLWKRPIVTRIEPWRGFYPARPSTRTLPFAIRAIPISCAGTWRGWKRCSARSRSGGNPISRATDLQPRPAMPISRAWVATIIIITMPAKGWFPPRARR